MPEESESTSGGQNRVWREFDGRAFMVHYAHVSNGYLQVTRCVVCREGISGLVRVHEVPVPEADVVQGSGVDEEESGPPSSDSWGRNVRRS